MQPKKKTCNGCDTEQYIWKREGSNRYCKQCWGRIKYSTDPPKPKKHKPIANKSKKQKELDKHYLVLRKVFLEKHPMCHAALPGCGMHSTDVHHMSKRGQNYLVVSTWLSVCRHCHSWIHDHPKDAKELNLLN